MFENNYEIHTFNTRHKTKLHLPHCRLATVQPGAYYSSINGLPYNIKDWFMIKEIEKLL
jgi:hypothetical protein